MALPYIKTNVQTGNNFECLKLKINQCAKIAVLTIMTLTLSSCGHSIKFADLAPVTDSHDDNPIDLPESSDFDMKNYVFEVLVERPAINALDVSPVKESGDVNSMDNVPTSSWYEPRLGYKRISPEELLRGPEEVGPPVAPLTVAKAKTGGGNPGFIIEDSRGELYLMKFDPPEFPAIETTTALIVNRLFWGFGYNVPEDYLYFFAPEELTVKKGSAITREDVDLVLSKVAPPIDGQYRTTVSYFIKGNILGPLSQVGVRKDDKNDRVNHENRRVLRALKVFGAFTNHSDMRIDNSLDVYVGDEGKGYVKHYLLDFGEAFGGHGAEHDRMWDGFEHLYSVKKIFRNIATLGLVIEDWENLKYTKWKSVGAFESEAYDPATWKETWPYEPIRISRRADDYWAAKILGALTREHLEVLIKEARYPEEAAADYMLKTILERQKKTLRYFLYNVTPLEYRGIRSGSIQFEDIGKTILGNENSPAEYQTHFYDSNSNQIGNQINVISDKSFFSIPLDREVIINSKGYFRVEVQLILNGRKNPPPAQFHFITRADNKPKLVGVVH